MIQLQKIRQRYRADNALSRPIPIFPLDSLGVHYTLTFLDSLKEGRLWQTKQAICYKGRWSSLF